MSNFTRKGELPPDEIKEIPEFWLTLLKNEVSSGLVNESNETVLRSLEDICIFYFFPV